MECARAAIRNKNSFLYAKYKKISARRGGKRAIIAVARCMMIAIYSMLKKKEPFRDLSSNYCNEINKDKILKRNIQSIQNLGYNVILNETAEAV